MKRVFVLLVLLGVLTLVVGRPVYAQETPSGDLTPAVQIEPEAEADVLADWTYRYIIPTGLALASVVILMTSIRYFTNVVRKRYRIVEE